MINELRGRGTQGVSIVPQEFLDAADRCIAETAEIAEVVFGQQHEAADSVYCVVDQRLLGVSRQICVADAHLEKFKIVLQRRVATTHCVHCFNSL